MSLIIDCADHKDIFCKIRRRGVSSYFPCRFVLQALFLEWHAPQAPVQNVSLRFSSELIVSRGFWSRGKRRYASACSVSKAVQNLKIQTSYGSCHLSAANLSRGFSILSHLRSAASADPASKRKAWVGTKSSQFESPGTPPRTLAWRFHRGSQRASHAMTGQDINRLASQFRPKHSRWVWQTKSLRVCFRLFIHDQDLWCEAERGFLGAPRAFND